MNSRYNIQSELNSLNSTLPADLSSPYSVSKDYFEGFAVSVLAKIKNEQVIAANDEIADLSPLLAAIPRTTPFTVPKNYFRETIENLPVLTFKNEESIVLSFIDKTMPYGVPLNYFDNLPEQILAKVSIPKAKVIPITKRKWMRMAVAAMVAGIMTISGFYYFGGQKTVSVNNPEWVAKNLKNVSDKALEEFINTTTVPSSTTETASNNANDVKKMLQDVSDKDLKKFLDQVPTDDVEMSN